MILDCVFLHHNVLEAVTSPGSPRRPRSRALRGASPAGRRSSLPRSALGWSPSCRSPRAARPGRGPATLPAVPLQRGPCGAGTGAGRMLVAQVAGAGRACAGGFPWPGSGWRWRGRSSSRTRRVHNDWETGVLVLFIPCTFHRHENWKRWNLWGKSNFPFLLNGFSLILTWFYHVPVEGLRVYTVC